MIIGELVGLEILIDDHYKQCQNGLSDNSLVVCLVVVYMSSNTT